ncbi:MAG: GNAT family N-acetyltransferase [Eubacteriales bacterium]
MNISDFTHNHIEEALSIAKSNYEEERRFVPILPDVEILPDLSHFSDNGLGTAIFDGGRMLGYLCCYNPLDNAFGTTYVKGTFSPIYAHGAVYINREKICKFLYKAVAEKWISKGIASHAIALYAHDAQAVNSFFQNGFGLRCIDAIRFTEEIECIPVSGYDFYELPSDRVNDTLPLKNMLIDHMGKSPAFLSYRMMDENDLRLQTGRRKSRFFIAKTHGETIAFIEITESGENFVCDDKSMLNICGAYCMPEHRGKGVYQNLLNVMITTLRNEGCKLLGVDFESFNPAAYGFWLKYFTAYTNSVVRRIDERILDI